MQDLLQQYGNPEIAIRLCEAEQFNLRNFEDVLICKQKSQDLMEKNKEALMQYVEEIKNLRSLILNDLAAAGGGGPGQSLVTETSGDKNNNNGGNVNTNNDGSAQNRTQGAAGAGQPGH